MGKAKEWLKYYGGATVGERGQIALPIEIRKRFNIDAGGKLLVMGFDAGNFEHIVLIKPDEVTGLLKHLLKIENFVKSGGTKSLEKMLKQDIKKK